jgi:hypothetical protein
MQLDDGTLVEGKVDLAFLDDVTWGLDRLWTSRRTSRSLES